MNVFNEKSHAFIAAKYYQYLLERFDERGKKAFVHATQYYAGQRGRRMAQRAIRDGKELTYETYCQYGEWINTKEIIEEGVANKKTIVQKSPDYIRNITTCPWKTQFDQMGSFEAGLEYCTHLDNSICRGFNPYIVYNVDLTNLQKNNGFCTHTILGVSIDDIDALNRPENLITFEYHCAHSYWSFREVAIAIFGFEGEEIGLLVLDDFGKEFSKESRDKLLKYRHTNFNITY